MSCCELLLWVHLVCYHICQCVGSPVTLYVRVFVSTWTPPPEGHARVYYITACHAVSPLCAPCLSSFVSVSGHLSLYVRVSVSLSTDLDSTAECAGQKAALTESQGGSAHGNAGGVEHFLGPKIKHFHSFVYP